ncbi:Nif3-like dinuclear metal center hexameric protein [Candidatus Parcubacteria bacterium]|nr:Nif3-like dinuclear metal center hexameric protein [Candidatus Parcubacteria bacterium]
MVKRDQLIKFIYQTIGRELLAKALKVDEVANGVQVLGKENVNKLALGVSCNEEFLKEAVKRGADFCIFHHGFDPRVFKSRLPLSAQKQLALIFKNDLTIASFHFALDSHPVIGNNATIIKRLGAKIASSFWEEGWGYVAKFPKPVDVRELHKKCQKLFDHDVLAVFSDSKKVKVIGVVSGSAKPGVQQLVEMEEKGVELFITGEPSESAPHKLVESGISYFTGGHYNTEVFGVQELGKKIKTRFGKNLKVEFIDIPNVI